MVVDIAAFIADFARRGVVLSLESDGHVFAEPISELTADEVALLRAHKAEVTAHLRAARNPRPPKRKHGHGVKVRNARVDCNGCEQKGQILHPLNPDYWRYWDHNHLEAVLQLVQPGGQLRWIAHRCVQLAAADGIEVVFYENDGVWSTERARTTALDGNRTDAPDSTVATVTVVAGDLPEVRKGQQGRGFAASLTGELICLQCGQRGRHDLTLLFWITWKRGQLAALVQAMQADEHLIGLAHQLVKLAATNGSQRTLHESGGAWRDASAAPDSTDPSSGPSDPQPRSQPDQTLQDLENLLHNVRARIEYWHEKADPELRLPIETLVKEAQPRIVEWMEHRDFDALRDGLLDLQRRLGDEIDRAAPPPAPDPSARIVSHLPSRDRNGCVTGAPSKFK
jgi:hypothetical protein